MMTHWTGERERERERKRERERERERERDNKKLSLDTYTVIGVSLSEPHIDHDNVPRHGECLYLSMYLSGRV